MEREMVIEGLRHCSTNTPTSCKECPYEETESHECITRLIRDALELIEDGRNE